MGMFSTYNYPLSPKILIYILIHFNLRLATATKNFKWVKMTHICLIWNQKFATFDV